MKINEKCLPCLINQVIKVANITNCSNRDDLYHQVFEQLSKIDFDKFMLMMYSEKKSAQR